MRRRCGARFVAATIHSADTAGYDRHPGGGTTRPKPAPRQGGGAGGGIMQRRLGMWCARPLLRGYIPRPAYPAGSGASYGARDAGRRRLPSAALAAAFCDGAMLLARAFAAVDGACPAPQIRPDPADVTTRLTPRQGGCASRGIMRRRNAARAAASVTMSPGRRSGRHDGRHHGAAAAARHRGAPAPAWRARRCEGACGAARVHFFAATAVTIHPLPAEHGRRHGAAAAVWHRVAPAPAWRARRCEGACDAATVAATAVKRNSKFPRIIIIL
ncbi:hypothetical protein M885DRAFT_213987 [Pelagophyceae sp. CCMP2097]|nr:hypothetical protein M885DRAFT_213987 [Pelagophyceae sp. CCMP2097]